MLKVGLTGNIGSGKTTVARIFEILEAPVFYADDFAKQLLDEAQQQSQIISRFGNAVLASDNRIDRKKLAQIVFSDPEALTFVNGLIHPLVRERFAAFSMDLSATGYVMYEAAVLIETGYHSQLDKVVLVTAPEELRIKRIIHRDKSTREQILDRMKNQWDEERKMNFSDFIIKNDEQTSVLAQCIAIHKQLTGSGEQV